MKRTTTAAFATILVCFLTAWAASVARAVDASQIDGAISNGKRFLWTQFESGNFERESSKYNDLETGQTALAVRALIVAGESYQEPRIAEAIKYIRKTQTSGVFSLGVRCQLWASLPLTPENKRSLAQDAHALMKAIDKDGKGKGFYGYTLENKIENKEGKLVTGSTNVRSSYYAALGLWSAAGAGVEVPDSYWRQVEKAWIDAQDGSGGWSFRGKGTGKDPVTPGTTANGIATLFITQDFLHADEGIALRGNIKNPSLDRGMAWLIANFGQIAGDKSFKYDFPYSTLYAIEAAGSASGLKYFKDIDWYDIGAERLLRNQKSDGSWPGDYGGAKITGTSFAMLFLASGRAPVMMNKLQYDVVGEKGKGTAEGNWNQRPRDVANVARWISKQVEKRLNWQIVNLKAAPVEDLHDAPILYLSGNQELKFNKDELDKLRAYIEGGGLILANADGGAGTFSTSFKNVAKSLFPAYEFRQLPASHTILTNEQYPADKWKKKPTLLAMGNGAREFMLLSSDIDLARAWQLQEISSKEELFQFTADLYQYAIDKREAHNRGDTYQVKTDPRIKPTQKLTVARLKYDGTWDPEPGGWRRIAAILNNRDRLGVNVVPVDPSAESISASGAKVAHLTGVGKFKLSDDARARVKKFVESGGLLIVDAAGGNIEFAQAAEVELSTMFGANAVKSMLPASQAIYNVGGKRLEEIGYRTYARQMNPGELKGPRLRGMEINGKLGVIFSPEDLSVGLVGQPVDGINGYDPKTATALVRNILLHATGVNPGASTTASASVSAKESAKPAPPTSQPSTKPTAGRGGISP